jgi:hypothetical protein
MNDGCFDRLSASLSTTLYRRRLLASLLGATTSALLSLHGTAFAKKKGKKKKKKCPADRARCGGKCCKANETCQKSTCVDHCEDGEKNFGETGIDCGGTCRQEGSSFGTCAIGQGCNTDDDCFSDICVSKGSGKECVFCRIDSDCDRTSSSGIRCLNNTCFECAISNDCPRPGQPATFNKCVESLTANCPPGQTCACGECRTGDDCPSGQLCDEDGVCFGDTCEASQDFCLDGRIGCNGNDNCICRQTVSNDPICAQGGTAICGCTTAESCAAFGAGAQCVRNPGANGHCESNPACQTICALPCE